MVRQKDKFWEYAEDLKGRFLCKFCQKNYSGGIARVKSHLSRLQGRDIAICNSVPEDVQALALVAVRGKDNPYKKRKAAQALTNIKGNGLDFPTTSSAPDSFPPQKDQASLLHKKDSENSTDKDKETVDRMVAQAFLVNNIAVDVIQSPSFIAMVKSIADFGSGYTLPSCTTLCTKLLMDARKEVDEYVSAVKGSWSLTGCTLMSDTWSNMKDCSFTNVIAYSPKGAVLLKSYVTDNRLLLQDILLPIIAEIGSENVVQIIVNDSDNESAKDLVTEMYPHIYRTQCASRGIHLLLEDIYKEVEWIRIVVNEAKTVVDNIYNHPEILKLARVHTEQLKRLAPSKTTFASYYAMLQSFIEVEDSLRTMVTSSEWNAIVSKYPAANEIAQKIQDTEFWNQGRELIFGLEALMIVVRLVDGEGSTAGYLYEAMEMVRADFKQRDETKYLQIIKMLNRRRNKDIVHKIHAAAAFLNPLLMYEGKVKYEQSEVRDGMNYVVERMVHSCERDDFAAQLLLYNGRSLKLFQTLPVLMMKKAHPRTWWEYNGGEVPLLRKIAIRILSQPCSSSMCGRHLSAFEVAHTKEINNKLCQDTSEDFIYTRMNSKMMASYRDLEMRDKFAIDMMNGGGADMASTITEMFCLESSSNNTY
ncbi:hypothetical protein ACHQM5_020622 [Ranunculus cassubicifolius]